MFLVALSGYGQSGKNVSLDKAIQGAAIEIQNKLSKDSKIVVYEFQTHNSKISDYVLKELFHRLVNAQKFTVLDRTAEEVVNAELNFQFVRSANMITDASLASLTERIGAGAIITGSLDDTGNDYRFRIRVIGTETMAAIVSYTAAVSKPPNAGKKIGTGALNIIPGLGSYLEGDIAGGITITSLYLVAAGLIAVDAIFLDWDSPAVGIPSTIGVGVAGFALVYGFARPFIHNYSNPLAAVIDNTQIKIVQTSDSCGGNRTGFQVSYTIKSGR